MGGPCSLVSLQIALCSHVPTVFPYLLPFELKQGRRQRQRRRHKTISDWLNEEK